MSRRTFAATPRPAAGHLKDMVRLVRDAPGHKSRWETFADFVEASAIAISNKVDPGGREAREKRHAQIAAAHNAVRRQFDDGQDADERAPAWPRWWSGFVRAMEPACGSGGMVVAMAEAMREEGSALV